jgi:hypothetical protein
MSRGARYPITSESHLVISVVAKCECHSVLSAGIEFLPDALPKSLFGTVSQDSFTLRGRKKQPLLKSLHLTYFPLTIDSQQFASSTTHTDSSH